MAGYNIFQLSVRLSRRPVAIPRSSAREPNLDGFIIVLNHTCPSSLCDSHSFGRMMEAKADSRAFFAAEKNAFLSDGSPYNWTIQKRRFPKFVPIFDFPHAFERAYEAARAVRSDSEEA